MDVSGWAGKECVGKEEREREERRPCGLLDYWRASVREIKTGGNRKGKIEEKTKEKTEAMMIWQSSWVPVVARGRRYEGEVPWVQSVREK